MIMMIMIPIVMKINDDIIDRLLSTQHNYCFSLITAMYELL